MAQSIEEDFVVVPAVEPEDHSEGYFEPYARCLRQRTSARSPQGRFRELPEDSPTNLSCPVLSQTAARLHEQRFVFSEGVPVQGPVHQRGKRQPLGCESDCRRRSAEGIYQDGAVAIDPTRQTNNGQPSLRARSLKAVWPHPGESALHIGCGTGYCTAILAELVGPSDRVVAYEIEPDLAARARPYLPGGSTTEGTPGLPQIHTACYLRVTAMRNSTNLPPGITFSRAP
jgi:hypothetical protein